LRRLFDRAARGLPLASVLSRRPPRAAVHLVKTEYGHGAVHVPQDRSARRSEGRSGFWIVLRLAMRALPSYVFPGAAASKSSIERPRSIGRCGAPAALWPTGRTGRLAGRSSWKRTARFPPNTS